MFTATICDEASAKAFLAWCVETIGLGFHPDTSFAEYVSDNGQPCFDSPTAEELDQQLHRTFAFCDPYDAGMSLFDAKLLAQS